jgi:hypothetical protein
MMKSAMMKCVGQLTAIPSHIMKRIHGRFLGEHGRWYAIGSADKIKAPV